MNAASRLSLTGTWSLVDDTGSYACPLALPGDGISALHAAGLVPEPYWGRNEYAVRWIAERDWTATRTVDLAHPAVDLVVSGLDTVATLRWYGRVVLEAQNEHRTYRVDLSGVAKAGENTVEITFRSPVREAASRQAAQPFPIPSMNEHPEMGAMCPIANGNMLRKKQCDFGWDWNIALAPFGLDGDIRLEPAGQARIERIAVRQDHADGSVHLRVEAHLAHADGQTARFAFHGQAAEAEVRQGMATAGFTIQAPALWWPNGQGDPVLHELTVAVAGATARRRIGLRRIELITEPDASGASFTFRINGRDLFAKGANWIPADALTGRITPQKTRALLESAADAHMNMIRVWGGGRYEADSFYDACDELGLLVWQDFMFACNLYPSTPAFLAEVQAEVRENVARLHHHACLALWCGDNELVGALSWFDRSRNDRDRYLVNYDRLNRAIEAALFETCPDANWWPSSPSLGRLDFRDGWHIGGQGDMHFWSVWHQSKDFDAYRDINVRFCSEFGFQSYPSMEVIRTFAEPADWNIASPVFESHQKNPGGNARIAETMFRYFRWPAQFEDFVWLSQVQQALAIHTAVTHWRGTRPYCMGTLYWQLNDTWPVCSWSSLNHGGSWKLLHHVARRFYAPLTVVCVPEKDVLVLRAVNDEPQPVQVHLTAYAVDMRSEMRELGRGSATVAGAALELLRLERQAVRDDEILVFAWHTDDGQRGVDHFAPRPYKAYDLPPSALALEQAGGRLTVTAQHLALFATVEADVPGRFSDNAFIVLPGRPVIVEFAPEDPGARPTFRLRDLHSATMGAATSFSDNIHQVPSGVSP